MTTSRKGLLILALLSSSMAWAHLNFPLPTGSSEISFSETASPYLDRFKRSLTTICVEIKPSAPQEEPYFMCKGSDLPNFQRGGSSRLRPTTRPQRPLYDATNGPTYSEQDSGSYFQSGTKSYDKKPPPLEYDTPQEQYGSFGFPYSTDEYKPAKQHYHTESKHQTVFQQQEPATQHSEAHYDPAPNDSFNGYESVNNRNNGQYGQQLQDGPQSKSQSQPFYTQHPAGFGPTRDFANPGRYIGPASGAVTSRIQKTPTTYAAANDRRFGNAYSSATAYNAGRAQPQSVDHNGAAAQYQSHVPNGPAAAVAGVEEPPHTVPYPHALAAPSAAPESASRPASIPTATGAYLVPASTPTFVSSADPASKSTSAFLKMYAAPTRGAPFNGAGRPYVRPYQSPGRGQQQSSYNQQGEAVAPGKPGPPRSSIIADHQTANLPLNDASTSTKADSDRYRTTIDDEVLAVPNWGFSPEEMNFYRAVPAGHNGRPVVNIPSAQVLPTQYSQLVPEQRNIPQEYLDDPVMQQFYRSLQEPVPKAPQIHQSPAENPLLGVSNAAPAAEPSQCQYETSGTQCPSYPVPHSTCGPQWPIYAQTMPLVQYVAASDNVDASYTIPPTGSGSCKSCSSDNNFQPVFIALPCYGKQSFGQQQSYGQQSASSPYRAQQGYSGQQGYGGQQVYTGQQRPSGQLGYVDHQLLEGQELYGTQPSYGGGNINQQQYDELGSPSPTVGFGNPMANLFAPPLFPGLGFGNPMARIFSPIHSPFTMLGIPRPITPQLGSTQSAFSNIGRNFPAMQSIPSAPGLVGSTQGAFPNMAALQNSNLAAIQSTSSTPGLLGSTQNLLPNMAVMRGGIMGPINPFAYYNLGPNLGPGTDFGMDPYGQAFHAQPTLTRFEQKPAEIRDEAIRAAAPTTITTTTTITTERPATTKGYYWKSDESLEEIKAHEPDVEQRIHADKKSAHSPNVENTSTAPIDSSEEASVNPTIFSEDNAEDGIAGESNPAKADKDTVGASAQQTIPDEILAESLEEEARSTFHSLINTAKKYSNMSKNETPAEADSRHHKSFSDDVKLPRLDKRQNPKAITANMSFKRQYVHKL